MAHIQGQFLRKGRARILSNHVRRPRIEEIEGRGTITTERGVLGDLQYHVTRQVLDARGYIIDVYSVVGTHKEAHKLCFETGRK